jgi:hypothetical protein
MAAMNDVKRAARFVHPLAAGAIVSLVFLQVYLIAAYIFGDSGVLDAHMTVGRVTVAFELLVLVTALVGWWGNRSQIATSSALFVTGLVQVSLAKDLGSSPEVHAFHGMLALAVFWLAWVTLLRSRAQVRTLGAA